VTEDAQGVDGVEVAVALGGGVRGRSGASGGEQQYGRRERDDSDEVSLHIIRDAARGGA